MGSSVEAEQLKRIVEGKIAERDAADMLLASGAANDNGQSPVQIGPGARRAYRTAAARKCDSIVKKYGRSEVLSKVTEYAKEVGVSPTTLRKHLTGGDAA